MKKKQLIEEIKKTGSLIISYNSRLNKLENKKVLPNLTKKQLEEWLSDGEVELEMLRVQYSESADKTGEMGDAK